VNLVDMNKALGLYDDVKGDMKFFVNSDVRSKILLSLREKPKDLPILRSELDFSSSTILHGIYQLEDKNFVFKNSGHYYLSQMGELAAIKLVNLMKSFSSMNKLESLFLNHEIEVIPLHLLEGIDNLEQGQIIESKLQNLMGSHKAISDRILNSKEIRLISSVFFPEYMDLLKDPDSLKRNVNLIMTDNVCDILLNQYMDDLHNLDNSKINIWKIDDPLKLSFAMADEFIALGLFLENGVYDSNRFLISEGNESLAWGNKLFNHYLDQATEFKL
jgi:predicted transcriptional regulator